MSIVPQPVHHQPHTPATVLPAHGTPMPANDALSAATPGVDPFDFVKADRIHVKDGSLFIDGYLVLHPHELAPENEAKVTKKLELTYSVNNPSFYESKERLAIALNLGQLIPVSLTSTHSKLLQAIQSYNAQVDSGVDADLLKLNNDKQHPFAALVRDAISRPTQDPVGIETLKNGLSLYLLMREKLTVMGYRDGLATYVSKANTPDQVLTDLGERIGVTPLQVREAALKGGIDGVGHLLQLDPAYVKDVKAFADYNATQEFSLNAVEHWHEGRHLLGIAAPIAQKIATGMKARIEKTISNARERVHHFYEVPDPVKYEEGMVAKAMGVLEPIQRALMFKLGYEIGYTPEMYADNIAFYPGIFGLHRTAGNNPQDRLHTTNHIYYSGRGDMKGAWRTLAHESAHMLFPEAMKPDEVAQMDALFDSDKARFAKLDKFVHEQFSAFDRVVREYQAGTPQEQTAILAAARDTSKDNWVDKYGIDVSSIIPYLHNGQDFLFLVEHAHDTLQDEGTRYAKSGYNSPQERIREVISRFAELKQVEYEAQPQLLHFVAPGLDQLWETHYIPHLKRVYHELEQGTAAKIMQPLRDAVPVAANAVVEAPQVEQHVDLKPAPVAGTAPHPETVKEVDEAPKVDQRPNPEPVGVPVVAGPVVPVAGTSPNPEPVVPPVVVTTPTAHTPEPVAPAPAPEPITLPPVAATLAPVVVTGTPDFAIDAAEAVHGGMVNDQSIAAAKAAVGMSGSALR